MLHSRFWSIFTVGCALITLCAGLRAMAAPEGADWRTAFAEDTYAAWTTGAPMPQLSAVHPEAALEDGYAIQSHFVRLLLGGERPTAFKAAIVAQAGQEAMGLDKPLVAVLPADGVLHARDQIVVDLSLDASRHLETEIGYLFAQPVTAPLPDVDTLRKQVQAVVAIVEVPGGPVTSTQPATGADLLAWNINAKQMIVGEVHAPTDLDVDTIEMTLTREGEVINTGRGDQAAGGQWATLLHTVNELIRLGYPLAAGDIITNGALGKVVRAEPGRHRAEFGPLGAIEFEVKAAAGP